MKVLINGKIVNLNDNNYKAEGGEGTIYAEGNTAFKIYHSGKSPIPSGKIRELSQINLPNVLAPKDIIYHPTNNAPMGFSMPYISSTEFLCKLFTKSYKDAHNVDLNKIVQLIYNMQKTLQSIHEKQILVVDYNEMNFLVDRTFTVPYYIDVDSYQTKSYPATALMESVRDRVSPKGQFSELTDWFSWAVVTFQLYIGIHPFKGKHPNYKPKDWLKRMDDGISVFNKDVSLPPNCLDLSIIPKPHLDWYEQVFEHGERTIPPFFDEVIVSVGLAQPKVIPSTENFIVKLIENYPEDIEAIEYVGNAQYVITKRAIFSGKKKIHTFTSDYVKTLTDVNGGTPLLCIFKNSETIFSNGSDEVARIPSNAMMKNNFVYTISNGKLYENTFFKFGGKILHDMKMICTIFESSYRIFEGIILQNILGKCWAAIPYAPKTCANFNIPELDGYRIIDAKYNSKVAIILGEKKGSYDRFTLLFNDEHSKYSIRIDKNVDLDTVNFVVLPNGVCVTVINGQKVEIFNSNNKVKEIMNPPFDSDMKLFLDGATVMFANKNMLHTVKLN